MKPAKFDFDTEFDENGEILREGESYKRFFTQDDVDAARMWGVEEGREEEEGRCAQALLSISSQIQLIMARLDQESEALRQEAAMLALASARKIGGAALDVYPVETINELAAEALVDLRSEPRFSVRCKPELLDDLSTRLEKTARDSGFEGAIMVRGDEELSGADVRMEWGSGAIQRSTEEIDARLQGIITRWLESQASEQAQKTSQIDNGDSVAGVTAA